MIEEIVTSVINIVKIKRELGFNIPKIEKIINTAVANATVVVPPSMIDDEATVKRFYRENGIFRLQPENPTMEPIIVPDLSILGKVVSLYRFY